MNFFDKTGKMAIGSRLRMLTDRITADATGIYRLYGLNIKPKWFPVLYTLAEGGTKTVTGIAKEIGQTHPSVSNIVKEMTAAKLVREMTAKADKRCTAISLTAQGCNVCSMLEEVCADVAAAVEEVSNATRHDLWRAIEEWEYELSQKSILDRVKKVRRERESQEIQIIPYKPRYQTIFRFLNEQWITQYWHLEDHDIECLAHPQESIIDKGGHIFVATYRDEPVGVCALCRMVNSNYMFELAKLAVDPEVRGKGIGYLLCKAAIEKARSLGAEKIFLESNTRLESAIRIYRKLGFRELAEYHPAYARGNIQMELLFQE